MLDKVYFAGTCRDGLITNNKPLLATVVMYRITASLASYVPVKSWLFKKVVANNIVDISFVYTKNGSNVTTDDIIMLANKVED